MTTSLALCLLWCASTQPAEAQPRRYTITDLGAISARNLVTPYRNCLNERGQVAGFGYNAFLVDEIGFLWDGTLQLLPSWEGAVLTRPQSLNDFGQIVGEIAFSMNNRRAVIWSNGIITDLAGLPEHEVNVAFGINNLGQVVGSSRKLANTGPAPVLWRNGEIIPLPVFPGAAYSMALHINEAGQIAGLSGPSQASLRAVLWENGTIKDLGTLGGSVARANAINELGQIAGSAALSNGLSHAVLWDKTDIRDLGTLGGSNSVANSLNDLGRVVGAARTLANENHAFFWEAGLMIDLNERIPSDSGWVLQESMGINNRGQITGYGLYRGATRAFLLDPVLIPDDPQFSQQWALEAIGAKSAWATSTGSSNVVVAVIHSGIRYDHEDLAANMWRNLGEIPGNNLDDDGNGYVDDVYGFDFGDQDSDPMDGHNYQGSADAGMIGAVGHNGTGIAGINWSVRLMAVRVVRADGTIPSGAIAQALGYVAVMKQRGENIRVVYVGAVGPNFEPLDKAALETLSSLGVLAITFPFPSTDNDASPGYPASYSLANIINVAGVEESGQLTMDSGWGRTNVHLAAPAGFIHTTGGGGRQDYVIAAQGGQSFLGAACVAGAAALLAAAWPDATTALIKAALLESVDLLPALTNKVVSHGRLNVGRAMEKLTAMMTSKPTLPTPSIERSGSTIVLSWPKSAASAVLEQTSRLPANQADWTAVSSPAEINGAGFTVAVPIVERAFFRLRGR